MQSLSLSLSLGNNLVEVPRNTLRFPNAHWALAGYDLVINNATSIPASSVNVELDWLHSSLCTAPDGPGAAHIVQGLALPPATGVYYPPLLSLGVGVVRGNTLTARVTLLPVGSNAALSRLSLTLQVGPPA